MKKSIKLKVMIINFLSSRINLTVFQCLLYLMIGYIMSEYLNWMKLLIMFALLLGIQFVTRIKAVSDGMMFKQIMEDHDMDANEIVRRMKEEAEKIDKEDLN